MNKILLLGTMLLISGTLGACAAGDVADDEANVAPSGGESVGRAEQEIGSPRLHDYGSVHYGGNILEEDHFPVWGGDCSPGYKRVDFPRARWNGNGACEFIAWDNPGNVRDCRAQYHVHTNAFWGGGTCEHWIYEERAVAGSCRDARGLRCGGASADGSCYCDDACLSYGDCCFDYTTYC